MLLTPMTFIYCIRSSVLVQDQSKARDLEAINDMDINNIFNNVMLNQSHYIDFRGIMDGKGRHILIYLHSVGPI